MTGRRWESLLVDFSHDGWAPKLASTSVQRREQPAMNTAPHNQGRAVLLTVAAVGSR